MRMLEGGHDSPQYLRYVPPHADTSWSGINVFLATESIYISWKSVQQHYPVD